jgi:ATP-dependent RNA helicase DeaD
MGREGVAYTFVTTEEGGELTRIEMLINRLLKRDEIEGFTAVAAVAPAAKITAGGAAEPTDEPAAEEEPTKPKPTPPGQRPRRRHRRAL